MLDRIQEELIKPDSGERIRFRFLALDYLMGGMRKGQLIVLGSMDSSRIGRAFACSLVSNVCLKDGKSCYLVSMDASADYTVKQIVRIRQDIKYHGAFFPDKYAPEEEEDYGDKIKKAFENWKKAKLWIDDTHTGSFKGLVSRIKKIKESEGIDLILIDNLMHICDRHFDTKNIFRMLKQLAVELGCPILVIMEHKRSAWKKGVYKPVQMDFWNAGQIEENADVILSLSGNFSSPPEDARECDVIIHKHGWCENTTAQIIYDPHINCFKDIIPEN